MRRVWKRAAGVLLSMILLVNMGMTVSAKVSYSDLSSDSKLLYDTYNSNLEELTDALEKYIKTGEKPSVGITLSNLSVEDARILLEYINGRNEFQGEWTEQMLEIRKILPSDWAEHMKWLYATFKDADESGVYGLGILLDRYIETGEPIAVIGRRLTVEEARVMLEYIKKGGVSDTEEKREHTETVDEKVQNEAVKEIDRVLQTGSATATFDGRIYGINTLSRDLMGEINRRGVSMVFKYIYNGYYYEITIPAGQAPTDPDVPWCGPMYLYSLFADTAVVTPVE